MKADYQEQMEAILRDLAKRCRADAVCKDLFTCIKSTQWAQMACCCELRLQSFQGSYDLYAQGATHTQLGALYMVKGQPYRALHHCQEAVQVFKICDGRSAGVAMMALGKVYESLGELEKASQFYQQSAEILSGLGDALAKKVSGWRSELGSPPLQRTAEAQSSEVLDQLCGWREEALSYQGLGGIYQRAELYEEAIEAYEQSVDLFLRIQDRRGLALSYKSLGEIYQVKEQRAEARQAYEDSLSLFYRLGDNLAANEILTKLQEVIRQEEQARTQEATKAQPTPPLQHKIRLIPLCKGKVAAGTPVDAPGGIDGYLTTNIFCIDDKEFYLREIFGVRGEPDVSSFNFSLLVTGKSMEPVIHEGDCVLVRKAGLGGVEVQNGDIVAVRVPGSTEEDEVTLKRFHTEKDHIRLYPENEMEKTIIILETEEKSEQVKGYYPGLVNNDRLLVIVGPEAAIEGKVVAVLSPKG